MILNVHEIFDKFESASSIEEKKQVLLNNQYHHIKEVLRNTFNPTIEFYAEPFPTDYVKPDTFPGIRIAGIESEIRKSYLFLKGNPTADSLTEQKRHTLLLQLLESFEPKEAAVWINMLNKDLQIPGLTKELVQEVFPELF